MKDRDYYLQCAWRMEREGGSFAYYIAKAFFHADKDNTERLINAFEDLFERFAPQQWEGVSK